MQQIDSVEEKGTKITIRAEIGTLKRYKYLHVDLIKVGA